MIQSHAERAAAGACRKHPSSTAATGANRFVALDVLRGVAAMSVVLFHANEGGHITALVNRMPGAVVFALRHGNLGISIFFVLSGFVISHSLYAAKVRRSTALRFMIRRSLRLSPPYWAAIAIAIGFALLSVRFVPGKPEPDLSFGRLAAHLVYLQESLGYREISPVFWTLCQEIQFYLVYAIILLIGRNDPSMPLQGSRTVVLLALCCIVSLLWPLGIADEALWRGSFLPWWHGFLLGVATYWSWRNRELAFWVFCFILVVAVAAFLRGDAFSLVACLTALVIFTAVRLDAVSNFMAWRQLQLLGLISYSLYLIHSPVTGAVFRAGYMLTGRAVPFEAMWWAVSIALCIGFAAVVYRLVERPSIRLASKVAPTAA